MKATRDFNLFNLMWFLAQVTTLSNKSGSFVSLCRGTDIPKTIMAAWKGERAQPTYRQLMWFAFRASEIDKKDLRATCKEWLEHGGLAEPISFEDDINLMKTSKKILPRPKDPGELPPNFLELLELQLTSTDLKTLISVVEALEKNGACFVTIQWVAELLHSSRRAKILRDQLPT